MSFDTIPILDFSLAKGPATKFEFLNQLRHALLEVGFLYLKNVGIPEELTQAVVREGVAFFDLPMEEKCVHPIPVPKSNAKFQTLDSKSK
jgi:isopenicillin N synthase-like dioxygenase